MRSNKLAAPSTRYVHVLCACARVRMCVLCAFLCVVFSSYVPMNFYLRENALEQVGRAEHRYINVFMFVCVVYVCCVPLMSTYVCTCVRAYVYRVLDFILVANAFLAVR